MEMVDTAVLEAEAEHKAGRATVDDKGLASQVDDLAIRGVEVVEVLSTEVQAVHIVGDTVATLATNDTGLTKAAPAKWLAENPPSSNTYISIVVIFIIIFFFVMQPFRVPHCNSSFINEHNPSFANFSSMPSLFFSSFFLCRTLPTRCDLAWS